MSRTSEADAARMPTQQELAALVARANDGDDEAVAAFQLCSRLEGIIPALEAAHALARVPEIAGKKPEDHLMVVNLSGRGDKDLASVEAFLGSKSR